MVAANSNGTVDQGRSWGGIPAGTTPAPAVSGVFRTFVDGESARIRDGKWGEQIRFPVRVSLGESGQRSAVIWCNHDYSLNGKLVKLLKAINGITGPIAPDFDLSSLARSGDIMAEIETDDNGYLVVTGFLPMLRQANGAPLTSDAPQSRVLADGRRVLILSGGVVVDAETGEVLADEPGF